TISPPQALLKLPVKMKKGETWEVDSTMNGTTLKGTFTSGEEEITVPKGKFKTVTVSCADFQIGDNSISVKYWFAPNVGMVKQELRLTGIVLTLELVDYKVSE